MPRLEDPPLKKQPLINAVDLAKDNAGGWVLAQTYQSERSARVQGSKLKSRFDGKIETRTSGNDLYIRWVA